MREVDTWGRAAHERMTEARLMAVGTANNARDFTMLSYPAKRNFDAVAAYIYPYSFWHSRTYAHWLKRVTQNPGMVAAYANYKEGMSKFHADQPEWYRYHVNTNELIGMDVENPLLFNLEATLNPLNGIAGVDFNDPYKRVDSFSRTLDDANKLGPSTWTPLNYAVAVWMAIKGEEEAMSRWGGRLIPQTATLKSITSLLNIERPEGIMGQVVTPGGVELDPMVHMFSGGIGPYERRRVGRALGALAMDGEYTDEEIIDAANAQQGPIWDQAMQNAARQRAPGQIMSFLGGPGFKARTTTDVSIDRMYTEYYSLWNQDANLSPEEVRTSMDNLRQRYPFMDAVLLSRKGGVLRDRAYAYNVLGRIPPSQSTEFAESVGLPPELMSQFYEDKGHIENWDESEQQRFMAGMADLGAALALPDQVTREDWNNARNAYSDMQAIAEDRWGNDLMDQVDTYFGMRGDTQEEKDKSEAFLEANPSIGEYLDWKAQAVSSTPQLASYYGGIEQIQSYWKGVMWNAIESELGEDVWNTWGEYWELKDAGGDYKSFWNAHPELDRYGDMKDEWGNIIEEQTIAFGSRLQEPMPATARDTGGSTVGQRTAIETVEEMAQPQSLPPEAIESALTNYGGVEFYRLVRDVEDMPDSVWDMLLDFSNGIGVDPHYIIEQIR
ncbi:MAG: hypothetical protein DRJ03_16530 [Chloroflexi bacterium]|nr:MAG: hypothetical protein DRJ03_16530 [Chloroflexota bacterium]